ncbi:MAG: hypothetical protein U1F34_02800 [Gammaproteobacteria bacterium]
MKLWLDAAVIALHGNRDSAAGRAPFHPHDCVANNVNRLQIRNVPLLDAINDAIRLKIAPRGSGRRVYFAGFAVRIACMLP